MEIPTYGQFATEARKHGCDEGAVAEMLQNGDTIYERRGFAQRMFNRHHPNQRDGVPYYSLLKVYAGWVAADAGTCMACGKPLAAGRKGRKTCSVVCRMKMSRKVGP